MRRIVITVPAPTTATATIGTTTVATVTSAAISVRNGRAVRRTAAAAGCAAVLLATAAACGTVENFTGGQKVDNAVDRLGEQKSLAVELSLDAGPEALASLAGGAGSGSAMPTGMAGFMAGLHVDVSVESKKPLAESGEKDLVGTSVSFAGADGVLAEYRVVGDFTYYRADAEAMSAAMGFPLPGADELPEDAGALRTVLSGKWVKLDNRELKKAQKAQQEQEADGDASGGAGGSDAGETGSGSGSGDIDAKTQQKVVKAVRDVIAHEVTFRDEGGSDGTELVVAKAGFRDLLTGLADELRPLQDELPPGTELPTAQDLKGAPDKKVAVNFTLKNGDLDRIEIDLASLADEAKGVEVPLVLEFGEAQDVSAPSAAEEVPVDAISGAGGLFSAGTLLGGMS
ncbi:hypothetical protein ACFV6E_27400 [Streptomyces sp. NPDC059785]|uniref:hypothetical protein n=1 Tax=Streptomyces sp. NPDC059785 TaxID=3346945 RepID=UPI00365F32D5